MTPMERLRRHALGEEPYNSENQNLETKEKSIMAYIQQALVKEGLMKEGVMPKADFGFTGFNGLDGEIEVALQSDADDEIVALHPTEENRLFLTLPANLNVFREAPLARDTANKRYSPESTIDSKLIGQVIQIDDLHMLKIDEDGIGQTLKTYIATHY